jgi:hypothetical protein
MIRNSSLFVSCKDRLRKGGARREYVLAFKHEKYLIKAPQSMVMKRRRMEKAEKTTEICEEIKKRKFSKIQICFLFYW